MRTTLRALCWIYLVLLVAAIAGNISVMLNTEYGVRIAGCYHYDAMLIGIACEGFEGASIVEAFLMWPFFLVYGPMLSIYSLLFLLLTILVWVPPMYLLFSYLRQWSGKNRLDGAESTSKRFEPPSF